MIYHVVADMLVARIYRYVYQNRLMGPALTRPAFPAGRPDEWYLCGHDLLFLGHGLLAQYLPFQSASGLPDK